MSWQAVWARKRRLFGTCSAVVLGVAFLAGTLVLGDTLRTGFDELFTAANAGTDVVVRGEASVGRERETQVRMVDESLVDDLAAIDGVADAAASIRGVGQVEGADGEPIGGGGPPTTAGNWIDDPELNPYRLEEGRAPVASGEIVIDRSSADDGALAVGDRTVVRMPAPVKVKVVGIASFGKVDSLSGTTFAAFTLDDAQQHLVAGEPLVTSVLLEAERGVSNAELVDLTSANLPDGIESITGDQLAREQLDELGADFLDFVQVLLLVFTGVALLVATFSIYNTFSVIVSQRTRESALLRALGASRGQVLRSIVIEAFVIGLVASVAGFALGALLARGLLMLVASMGAGLPDGRLDINLDAVIIAVVAGVTVTLVASLAPAIKASRVAPLAALREVSSGRSHHTLARALIGSALSASGLALVLLGGSDDGGTVLQQAGLGAVLMIAGMVVLGPVIARPAMMLLGAPLRLLRGISGDLAGKNAQRSPTRTSATASALMVGVAVVSLFTVFASSIKASIEKSVDTAFGGDLVIMSTDFSGSGLDPALAAEVGRLPEVSAAAGLSDAAAFVDGDERDLTVVDPVALDEAVDLDLTEGDLSRVGSRELAVSDRVAEDEGWTVGASVPVRFADGSTEAYEIGAIFGVRDLLGDIVMVREDWEQHTPQVIDVAVLITLADGVGLDEGRAAVASVTEARGAPDPQDDQEYVDSLASEIDQMLVIVYAMLALSIVIALMGIANTLSLSIYTRTRELGLLRAVGLTRAQMRSMVRWESVLIALFGTVGGIGLGLFLGWGLMRAVAASEGMGVFAVPVGQLAAVVVAGAAAGILAGVRPARRAARLDVLAAVTAE